MYFGKSSLKYKLYLPSLPVGRQRKLRLVLAMFVGNALRGCLAIEAHAILIGAEALQFPTGRHTDLCPFAAVAPVGALEIPLHHVVTPPSAQVLAAGFRVVGHHAEGGGCP